MIEGIDYYAGNGSPSLAGYGFAFVKATEGIHYSDPAYTVERARIGAAGLVFGAYHFGHPEQDVAAEVEHFLAVAQPRPGDVLFLDFEEENNNWYGLTNTRLTWWKNAWLTLVKQRCPGNRVGLYCSTDTWLHKIDDSNAGDFLFIAEYGVSQPTIRDPWLIWQHDDGGGVLDHDVAQFPSVAAMRAWAHQAPTPTPSPPPAASLDDDEESVMDAQVPSGFAYQGHTPANPAQGSIINPASTLVLAGEWGNGGPSKRGVGYLSVAVGEGAPVRLRIAFNQDGSGSYDKIIVMDAAPADGRVGVARIDHGGSVLVGRVKRTDTDNTASATTPVTVVVVEGPRPA